MSEEDAMTPQERQLIDELFERLAKVENAARDPEAMSAIMQGLRNAPNAIYPLVQTVLLQDEALRRAPNASSSWNRGRHRTRPSPAASSIQCATSCSASPIRRAARFPMFRRPYPKAGRSGTPARCCSKARVIMIRAMASKVRARVTMTKAMASKVTVRAAMAGRAMDRDLTAVVRSRPSAAAVRSSARPRPPRLAPSAARC